MRGLRNEVQAEAGEWNPGAERTRMIRALYHRDVWSGRRPGRGK